MWYLLRCSLSLLASCLFALFVLSVPGDELLYPVVYGELYSAQVRVCVRACVH